MQKMTCLAVLAAVLSACSSVAVDPENPARNSSLNLFTPIPGKAVVYVYRDDAVLDGYYTSKLIVNGHFVSTGARNSFNVLVLPPGDYDIGVTSVFQQGKYLPMDVHFEAGEVHYLNVYWKKNAHWEKEEGFRLKAVVDTNAKKVISAARMIAFKELCQDYTIDDEQRKKLGNAQVYFRPYRQGICSPPHAEPIQSTSKKQ